MILTQFNVQICLKMCTNLKVIDNESQKKKLFLYNLDLVMVHITLSN